MSSEFDWSSDEDVILPSQRAVAVYRNPKGGFVIRQEDDGLGDQAIVLNDKPAVRSLIKALRDLMRDGDAQD